MAHSLHDEKNGIVFHFDGGMNGFVEIVQLEKKDGQDVRIGELMVPIESLEMLIAEKIRRVRTEKLEQASDRELLGLDDDSA